MNYVLFPNELKKAACKTAVRVSIKLHALGANIFMDDQLREQFSELEHVAFLPASNLLRHADFAVAIGGDGTILRCACRMIEDAEKHGTEPGKLVGINTGTLGFLAAFEEDELDMFDRLQAGQFAISQRMLLQTTVQLPDGTCIRHALNDIYASRLNGKICDFAVAVDDRQIGIYRADGIIFSTPTGSTAYALSAGGPVMEPDLNLIEMNLICPHSLFARPMLFAPQRTITVTYRGVGYGGLNVHVDGVQTAVLHNNQSFTVTSSTRSMPFVDCKGYAFYDALNGKLMQPLKGLRDND